MKIYFDHEKLDVYQESIAFCGWVGESLTAISSKAAAKDQLDRASTSILLNIAEGNGKFSSKDRARFFEVAQQKEKLARIVQMLIGLLRKFSERADILREEEAEYSIDHDYEHEQEHE